MYILLPPTSLYSTCHTKEKRHDSCLKSQSQLDTMQKLQQELNVLPSFFLVFFIGSIWHLFYIVPTFLSQSTLFKKFQEGIFQLKGRTILPIIKLYRTHHGVGVARVAIWLHVQILSLTNLVMYQTSDGSSFALAFVLCFVDKGQRIH